MTPELAYLVWSAALTFVLVLIAVSGATLQVGLVKLASNREDLPEMVGWAGRAQRAHRNMLESLICSPFWCWWRTWREFATP